MHDEDNYRYIGSNRIIDLTIKENKILGLLIQRKGNIVTHEELCMLIYGDFDCCYQNCLSHLIFRLRQKLKGEVKIINKPYKGYTIER